MARRRRRSCSASRRSRRSRRRSAPSRRPRTASTPRPCGRAPGSSTAPSSSGASPSTSTPDGGSSARGRHAEGPLAPPRAPCARGRPLPDRGLLGVRLRDPVPPAAGDRRAAVPGLRAPARACPDRVGLRVPRVRPLSAEPPRLASLRVVRRGQGLHARRARPRRDHDLRLPRLRLLAARDRVLPGAVGRRGKPRARGLPRGAPVRAPPRLQPAVRDRRRWRLACGRSAAGAAAPAGRRHPGPGAPLGQGGDARRRRAAARRSRGHPRRTAVLNETGDDPVAIHFVPDVFGLASLRGGVEEFESIPFVHLREFPLYGWNRVAKRVLDLIVGGGSLGVAAPVMFAIATALKLVSRGPVLYRQERMGLDGQRFRMLKFRTMRVDAERETGPVWARPDDSRRTRLGTFLRRWSLDELPQLWNVLRGEMSLVGPRPERPSFVEEFRRRVPGYMLRHKMKAGITGWAQINGWRGQTSIEKRIEYDLYYIERWSLGFDLKILLLTFWSGFRNRNAY